MFKREEPASGVPHEGDTKPSKTFLYFIWLS
jgi:hypothetical protein